MCYLFKLLYFLWHFPREISRQVLYMNQDVDDGTCKMSEYVVHMSKRSYYEKYIIGQGWYEFAKEKGRGLVMS